ncbi:MAG TPA: hypothetical protein VEV63_07390 [Streptosporangiaceae bacterium]|nr:hypothetical protein [Streptosporangiaceae bacterium]
MRIEVLMVANSASADDGLLTVHGGGWEHTVPRALPCTLTGYLAGIAVLDDGELGTTPVLALSITDLGGNDHRFSASVVINGNRPAPVPGVPIRAPFAVPFTFSVLQPTVVQAHVAHAGAEIATVSFLVSSAVSDAPPPAAGD